jgi:hypothetical protein
MHIGWRKAGNLQQTRPYVLGRSMWGALTARLVRESRNNDYNEMGKKVDEQLAFTYFYPSNNPHIVSHWPWGTTRDEFAWKFLGSYASTSLTNGRNAEEGSLHETEYIAPYTRDGEEVYLIGYMFEREDYSISVSWRDMLSILQIGGERNYGWGRVRVEDKPVLTNTFPDYELVCTNERPQLIALKGTRVLAHTRAMEDDQPRGILEPLSSRITTNKGFGQDHSKPEICWVPGGTVKKDERFEIQEKGVWEHLPPDQQPS